MLTWGPSPGSAHSQSPVQISHPPKSVPASSHVGLQSNCPDGTGSDSALSSAVVPLTGTASPLPSTVASPLPSTVVSFAPPSGITISSVPEPSPPPSPPPPPPPKPGSEASRDPRGSDRSGTGTRSPTGRAASASSSAGAGDGAGAGADPPEARSGGGTNPMRSSAERSIEGKGLLSKTCSRLLRSTAAPSLRAWPRTATMVASAIQERAIIFAISPFGPVVTEALLLGPSMPHDDVLLCNCRG